MALDLALWVGVKLEDAAVIDVAVDRVNKYCDRLQQAIDNLHEELLDQELQRHRSKMAKEANAARAHHFQVGDLVMVTVADTAMNPVNTSKPRLHWQGPCEVVSVEPGAPSELHVRLVGDNEDEPPKPVHWTRVRRFAGKEFHATPKIIRSAHHDWGKFKIRDFLGWRVGDERRRSATFSRVGRIRRRAQHPGKHFPTYRGRRLPSTQLPRRPCRRSPTIARGLRSRV